MLPLPEGMIVHPPDRKVTLEWWTFSVAAHWLRSFHWTFMWVPCPMDFYHLILRSRQLNGCMTNITTLWNHSCHCLKLVVDVQNPGNGHDVLYLRHLHCCPGTLESRVIISGYSRGSWRSVSIGQFFFFNAPTRKQQTPMPHVVRCVSRCKYIMKAIETSMSFGDFPERHGPGWCQGSGSNLSPSPSPRWSAASPHHGVAPPWRPRLHQQMGDSTEDRENRMKS